VVEQRYRAVLEAAPAVPVTEDNFLMGRSLSVCFRSPRKPFRPMGRSVIALASSRMPQTLELAAAAP
jgi:hypothetical protein